MVLILVLRDGLYYSGGLVDDDAPQAVLLVQVCVEVLLHRLTCLVVHVHALIVVLDLLLIDVSNEIPDLL